MASAWMFDQSIALGGTIELPSTRGPILSDNGMMLSRFRAPTDPAGTVNISFPGIVAGTEIAVIDSTGELIADIESAITNQVVSLSYYASGNSLNNVIFRLVALNYEVMDISYTLSAQAAAIPVQQRFDRNYLNP